MAEVGRNNFPPFPLVKKGSRRVRQDIFIPASVVLLKNKCLHVDTTSVSLEADLRNQTTIAQAKNRRLAP
jgi:hypothetical protein